MVSFTFFRGGGVFLKIIEFIRKKRRCFFSMNENIDPIFFFEVIIRICVFIGRSVSHNKDFKEVYHVYYQIQSEQK